MPTAGGMGWWLKKFGIKARPQLAGFTNRTPGDRTPESHGSWKGGKQVVLCDVCGKKLLRFSSHIHDKNFCNKDCYGIWKSENFQGDGNPNHGSIAMFGSANPNWKGGTTWDEYCETWKDRDFKNDIKLRDNHECQNPDCRKNSKKMDVHHIDYNKKNCHPKNLITLCTGCNARANFKRDFWQSGYMAIIESKYHLHEIKRAA